MKPESIRLLLSGCVALATTTTTAAAAEQPRLAVMPMSANRVPAETSKILDATQVRVPMVSLVRVEF